MKKLETTIDFWGALIIASVYNAAENNAFALFWMALSVLYFIIGIFKKE